MLSKRVGADQTEKNRPDDPIRHRKYPLVEPRGVRYDLIRPESRSTRGMSALLKSKCLATGGPLMTNPGCPLSLGTACAGTQFVSWTFLIARLR